MLPKFKLANHCCLAIVSLIYCSFPTKIIIRVRREIGKDGDNTWNHFFLRWKYTTLELSYNYKNCFKPFPCFSIFSWPLSSPISCLLKDHHTAFKLKLLSSFYLNLALSWHTFFFFNLLLSLRKKFSSLLVKANPSEWTLSFLFLSLSKSWVLQHVIWGHQRLKHLLLIQSSLVWSLLWYYWIRISGMRPKNLHF